MEETAGRTLMGSGKHSLGIDASWAGLREAVIGDGGGAAKAAWTGPSGTDVARVLDRAVRAYLWGSRVYGTASARSDWDVLVIIADRSTDDRTSTDDRSDNEATAAAGVTAAEHEGPYALYDDGLINMSFYTLAQWTDAIREHRHDAMECCFLPRHHRWLEIGEVEPVIIDPDVLARRVSWEARRRINIAKEKQSKTGDDPRKDIVHSLRYLLFALQILRTGSISNYGAANEYYAKAMSSPEVDWPHWIGLHDQLQAELSSLPNVHPINSRCEISRLAQWRFRRRLGKRKQMVTPLQRTKPTEHAGEQAGHPWIVELLQKGVALEELSRSYGVSFYHVEDQPGLMHFSYASSPSMQSDDQHIILDINNNWKILCWPPPSVQHLYSLSSPFDWDSAQAFTYVDGLTVSLYHHSDAWHLALADYPDDSMEEFPCLGSSFQTAFWHLWSELGYSLPQSHLSRTYTFKVILRKLRFITRTPSEDIVLVGARDVTTLLELNPIDVAEQLNWHTLQEEKGITLADAQTRMLSSNPLIESGFVFVDSNLRRVKLMSRTHVWLQWTLPLPPSNAPVMLAPVFEDRRMRESVRTMTPESLRTFIAYWPQFTSKIQFLAEEHDVMCAEIQEAYEAVRDIEDLRKFSSETHKYWCGWVLLILRKQPFRSAREYLALCPSRDYWSLCSQYAKSKN